MSQCIWTGQHDDYRGMHGKRYEQPDKIGYAEFPVLTFLVGQPWDELALRCVHSLRPSMIRVTEGEETTDSQPWRVTVCLERDGHTIARIKQEVEVSGGTGSDLYVALRELGIEL